jgi:hypothetical protein
MEPPAQEDGIVEARLAAVGPVSEMMRVGEPETAARESAATVPDVEGTAQRGGDRARAAADVEYRAVLPSRDPDEPGVARETSRRFR